MDLQCVAIRLIRVKWHVTKIEQPTDGNSDDDEDEGLDWSNFQGRDCLSCTLLGRPKVFMLLGTRTLIARSEVSTP